jgi:lipopolysaccharide export system permease protein
MIIILHLPSVFVMTIPMGVLLSTVMTLNGLSLSSEITVMRACGIGLNRIAKPIFVFAIVMGLVSFSINEFVVPVMTKQATNLALWAFGQKNIPEGKHNFTFKELKERGVGLLIALMANNNETQRFYNSVKDASIHDTGIWIDIK